MAGILLPNTDVTDEERAAHARDVAERGRAAAIARQRSSDVSTRNSDLSSASRIPGKVLIDQVIPPGGHWSAQLAAGARLRIIDLEGRQAVDFMCYDANDTANRYNAANTIKMNGSIFISLGSKLYSDRADVLMTVRQDTVGYHDTIGGCCSKEANYLRYGINNTPNCRDNFVAELSQYGMNSRDLPANVNFFMYVPVRQDGSTEITEGKSEPGDFVELEAIRNTLAVISNCPQIYNPCNGWNPTPVRVIVWK